MEKDPTPPNLPPCKTCGNPVSPFAKACPKCGAPSPLTPPALKAVERVGCLLTAFVTVPIVLLFMFGYCAQ